MVSRTVFVVRGFVFWIFEVRGYEYGVSSFLVTSSGFQGFAVLCFLGSWFPVRGFVVRGFGFEVLTFGVSCSRFSRFGVSRFCGAGCRVRGFGRGWGFRGTVFRVGGF